MNPALTLQEFDFPKSYVVEVDVRRDTFKDLMSNISDRQLRDQLARINGLLEQDPKSIRIPEVYDFLFEVLIAFENDLNFKPLALFQDVGRVVYKNLCNVVQFCKNLAQGPRLSEQRNTFKMSLFLSFYVMVVALTKRERAMNDTEKINKLLSDVQNRRKKKKYSENPDLSKDLNNLQGKMLYQICKSLDINLRKLWGVHEVDEVMLGMYVDMGVRVIEGELKNDDHLKNKAFQIFNKTVLLNPKVSLSLKKNFAMLCCDNKLTDNVIEFFSGRTSPELQLLCQEVSIQLADKVRRMTKQDDLPQVKNACKFLLKVCEKHPRLFYRNLSQFSRFYEHQNYLLRNLMSDIIFHVVKRALDSGTVEDKDQRKKLVGYLIQRVYDKNSHCRSHTLAVLGMVMEANVADRDQILEILTKGLQRTSDVSVNVRRKGLQLVHQAIKIFYFLFKPDDSEKLLTLSNAQKEAQIAKIAVQSLQSMADECQTKISECREQNEMQQLQENLQVTETKLKDHLIWRNHYDLYVTVLKLVHGVIENIKTLIHSINTYDLLESIKLIVCFYQIGIEKTHSVLITLWTLVDNDQKSVREAILDSFITIYLNVAPEEIALNMINLFSNASEDQVHCLQCMIPMILEQREKTILPTKIAHLAWYKFTQTASNPEKERQCLSAVRLAYFFFTSQTNLIKLEYIDYIIIYIQKQIRLKTPNYRVLCVLSEIFELNIAEVEVSKKGKIIGGLIKILVQHIETDGDNEWYNLMRVWGGTATVTGVHPDQFMITLYNAAKQHVQVVRQSGRMREHVMAKMLWTVSTMMTTLMHMEDLHESKLRTAIASRANIPSSFSELDQSDKGTNDPRTKQYYQQQMMHELIEEIHANTQKVMDESKEIEEWLDMCAEILNKCKLGCTHLERIASIALSNFILHSSKRCRKHLPLMCKVIDTCEDPAIRLNVAVGMSDIMCRYSLEAQPYIGWFYKCLHDKDPFVNQAVLDITCDMIMTQNIKLGKEICYLAMLFEYGSTEQLSTVRSLLMQLHRKSPGLIHNLIPEMIINLSRIDSGVYGRAITKNTYEAFAKDMLPHLEKDKASADLIQYIASQMSQCLDVPTVRNTAITLTYMGYNSLSLRKLIDLYPKLRDKLQDEVVAENFKILSNKLKKSHKTDMKPLADEFQAKFVRLDDRTEFSRYSAGVGRQAKPPKRQPTKKGKAKGNADTKIVEEEDQSSGSQRGNNEPIQINSDEEEEVQIKARKEASSKPSKNKHRSNLRANKRIIQESDQQYL